jgi:excinuclease ABC subunit B
MKNAIYETERRRKIQTEYNEAHGIIPKTVIKGVHDVIDLGKRSEEKAKKQRLTKEDKEKLIEQYTAEMREASRKLEFEKAAFLRDKIKELKTTKQVKK